jgi:hypothetical protein
MILPLRKADLVIAAKNETQRKEMMKSLGKYARKKNLELS